MQLNIFHIFRNTPLGRETFRQAADFSKKTRCDLHVHIPQHDRFLMFFKTKIVEVALDSSYLYFPDTAFNDMQGVLDDFGVVGKIVEAKSSTAANLPDLPTHFDLFSLPRILTERKSPMLMGTTVRIMVKASHGPVLISPGRFHDWNEIIVLFGGSEYSLRALRWALSISRRCGLPLKVLTLAENDRKREYYEQQLVDNNIRLSDEFYWLVIENTRQKELLRFLPRNAMIVMGAYGGNRIRRSLFGSTTELIIRNTASLLFLVGEHCKGPLEA